MSVELTPELILYAENLARKAAQRWRANPFYDDLISAGREMAVKVARDYDPSRFAEEESRLKAYLAVRVRGAVWDEVRRLIFTRWMGKHGAKEPRSLDQMMIPDPRDGAGYELADWQVDIADRVADAMLLDYLVSSLGNERERYIIRQRVFLGRSQASVGADLGVSEARICQIEGDLRKRARSLEAAAA